MELGHEEVIPDEISDGDAVSSQDLLGVHKADKLVVDRVTCSKRIKVGKTVA